MFYFWRSYFRDNKVRSIITGHFVYSYGLIVRIALKKKIECYNVTLMRIFKGTNENPTFDGRAFKFKKIINNTPKRILKNGLRSSKKILNKRIKHGKILGSDIPYVSKSSFRSTNKDDLINNNKTKKVLICMHDFFDAAHINRNNLFNDFSDWLEFLGKLSNKTNYDWYIKTHPFYEGKFKFYQSISFKTMENIVKKYNKIKILPNTYNHNQLVKNGIDLVLTVYGTVAMEYAYLNTKVITACKNNLFSEFNFNIHPTSIKDYERKILNFEKIKLIISKKRNL